MTQVNQTQVNSNQVTINEVAYTDKQPIKIDGMKLEVEIQEQYFRGQVKDGKKVTRPNAKFATSVIPFNSTGNEEEDNANLAMALTEIIAEIPKQVKAILDKAVLDEVKRLFVENKDDWNYLPDFTKVSLKQLGDKLLEPTRKGRIVTKATLALLADWYKGYAVSVLGKTEQAAKNGADIIASNFAQYVGEVNVLKMFVSMFEDVDIDNPELISEDNAITLQAVTNQLNELLKVVDKPILDVNAL